MPGKRIIFFVGLILILFMVSCSRGTSPVSYGPREPLQRSTRAVLQNQPVNEVGGSFGVTNVNTSFTGVRDMDSSERFDYYTSNMLFSMGGFYRYGVTERMGLTFGLDYQGFEGNVGAGLGDEYTFSRIEDDELAGQGVIGGTESNFFEGGHDAYAIDEPETITGRIHRFDNQMLSFSVKPYFMLPFFEGTPQRLPSAKRIFLFTGISANINFFDLYDQDGEVIDLDAEQVDVDTPGTIAFSFPMGLGFSWRITESISLGYTLDYHWHLDNVPSGISKEGSADRHFNNRINIGFRLD